MTAWTRISHQHVQHITKQQHNPSHMETSKHTNSKSKQRHEYRHIIQAHLPSLTDSKKLEKTLLPSIRNNIPPISAQHGFTSNHSTSTALHNTIATGFNQNKPPESTITVAIDMSKTFDNGIGLYKIKVDDHKTMSTYGAALLCITEQLYYVIKTTCLLFKDV